MIEVKAEPQSRHALRHDRETIPAHRPPLVEDRRACAKPHRPMAEVRAATSVLPRHKDHSKGQPMCNAKVTIRQEGRTHLRLKGNSRKDLSNHNAKERTLQEEKLHRNRKKGIPHHRRTGLSTASKNLECDQETLNLERTRLDRQCANPRGRHAPHLCVAPLSPLIATQPTTLGNQE